MEPKVELTPNVDQGSYYTDVASNQWGNQNGTRGGRRGEGEGVGGAAAAWGVGGEYLTQGKSGSQWGGSPASKPVPDTAEPLATSITRKLSMLAPHSHNYGTVCIYKVAEKYRNKNQEAYTPRLISIGLLHHGEGHLQGMEECKLKYLNNFLQTFRVPIKKLAEFVHDQEKLVSDCYESVYIRNLSKLSKEKLSEVILLDGIFIVELFLRNHFPEMREIGDIIFDNPWVSKDILHDLMLFENQLPMKFVCALYDTFVRGNVSKCLDDDVMYPLSFNELAHKYFRNVGNTRKLTLTRDFCSARHLVEFLSILHMPDHDDQIMYPNVGQKVGKKSEFTRCATATELLAAGVKFRSGTGKCFFDVKFTQDGELQIPQLTVNDSTETFFRNLIAFEQSGYHSKYMTSFVILLDNLIDTPRDVDILKKHEIIIDELGSSEQLAELFNNLYKDFVNDPKEFYFVDICSALNHYSRDLLHKCKSKLVKWFTQLGNDYFGSPWSIISVVAAFILLGLTVIQTVCALLQV